MFRFIKWPLLNINLCINLRNLFYLFIYPSPSKINSTLSVRLQCGKILYSEAGHRWQYGACALHAGYLRLQIHTLRLCNTHCFATATLVARTRLNVTLYIHCLSCLVSEQISMTLDPNITIILLSFLFPSVSPHEHAWQFLVAGCFSLGQLWRPVLRARWSTTTFCVSCSCMAWQPFSWSVYEASRTSRMTSMWCIFLPLVQRGSLPIET